MRYRSSEFDEMLFIKFDEINFVKFDETSFIKFNKMTLCLMSRFRQNLMSRFCQALIISKRFESNNRNINDEMIKHDQKNEYTKIFLSKEKSEIAFFDHISHFETKCKTRY